MNKTIPMIAAAALFTVSVVAANGVVQGNVIKHYDAGQAKIITLDHASHVANSKQAVLNIGNSAA